MRLRIAFLFLLLCCAMLRAADEAPTIIQQPMSQVADALGTVTFSVRAGGSTPLSYRWSRNGAYTRPEWNRPSLTLIRVDESDVGSYTVTVSNSAGSVTSEAVVLSLGAPIILKQPADATVTAGEDAIFVVAAIGKPLPKYQWKKNGAILPDTTAVGIKALNVKEGDGAVYSVVVSNSAGSVTSREARLSVKPKPPEAPPVANTAKVPAADPAPPPATAAASPPPPSPAARPVTKAPEPPHESQIDAVPGQPVKLAAAADGTPPFTFQWLKNDQPIRGATNAALAIAKVRPEDAGVYTCIVSNRLGSSRSPPCKVTVAKP